VIIARCAEVLQCWGRANPRSTRRGPHSRRLTAKPGPLQKVLELLVRAFTMTRSPAAQGSQHTTVPATITAIMQRAWNVPPIPSGWAAAQRGLDRVDPHCSETMCLAERIVSGGKVLGEHVRGLFVRGPLFAFAALLRVGAPPENDGRRFTP